MSPFTDEIYHIILLSNNSLTINEIVDIWNNNNPLALSPATYTRVRNAISYEWRKGNYVFYQDDCYRPIKIGVNQDYYTPNGRIVGP